MSGDAIKDRARSIAFDPKSRYALLQKLILEGLFDSPVSSEQVVLRIRERFGKKWKTSFVQVYMLKFMNAGVIHAVRIPGHKGNYWVLSSVSRERALKAIASGRKAHQIAEELFSEKLTSQLKNDFGQELQELHDNFGRNGNCTAFLLRKILEKLIIVVLAKNGREKLLEDRKRPGGWAGLKQMLDTAAQEKLHGIPFLVPKTANEIKGIKFLGDTAAHNPLVGVDTKTILPQMPYIVTAYEELAKRL